jgi:hypothetical protein
MNLLLKNGMIKQAIKQEMEDSISNIKSYSI